MKALLDVDLNSYTLHQFTLFEIKGIQHGFWILSSTQLMCLFVAFDPAGPSWGSGTDRIRASDSAYTEVIHTDAGALGLKEAVGHNDFYPNGGSSMPGCGIINVGCSHSRSYDYFANSIDNTFFQANQCASVDEATSNKCSNLSKSYMGGSTVKPM